MRYAMNTIYTLTCLKSMNYISRWITLNHMHHHDTRWVWMRMKSYIAYRFGVIVHCLNTHKLCCMTCFPFWKGPYEFYQHQMLTLAHVHGNNFMMVQLQGEYLMSPITPFWTSTKTGVAAQWKNMYSSRLQLVKQLTHREREFINLG